MSRPNIIFILLDDFGWRDLACYGSSFYETPNVDRLAAESMRFTDAYASCPVCSPTRASVVTGRYPATVGITNWIAGAPVGKLLSVPYLHYLPCSERTVATALREADYATWHVGKWHLGGGEYAPDHHGFDVNIGGCEAGSPGRGGYFSPWSIPALQDASVPDGTYLTDHLTDEAIRLIRTEDNKPFFLHMSYYTVHTPLQAKDEYMRKYRAKAEAMGLDKVTTFEDGDHFPCEHKRDQRIRRRLLQSDPVYAGMIQSMDENVGRLLEAVGEAGLAENTIIMFTSDNGGLATSEGSPTCNAPLAEGKGWMYEGGTREPLIVKWPGVTTPGSVCRVPVTTPDFYPTMIEMAGLDPAQEPQVEGVSIAPLLRGGDHLDREAIFWHYPHYSNQGGTPGSSVRMGDYKLIEFFEDGRLELYNLRDDISEENDLAREMPERAHQMQQVLARWRESVEAKIPEPNPDWRVPV